VGDIKSKSALEMIDKYFGAIKSAPKPIPQVYTIEPPQEGERRFEVNRAGDLSRVWIGYHIPEAAHKDTYALSAIRHILGGTYERSSRLYASLIDSGIACDAFARHYDLRDPGLFIVGAMLNPGIPISKAEEVLHAELERLTREPVKTDELKRAKIANEKGTVLAKAEPNSFAFMLAEAESRSDWHWLVDYDENFDRVSVNEIMEVAKRYFKKENRTVGHFIPRQQELEIMAEDHTQKFSEGNGKTKIISAKEQKAQKLEYTIPKVKVAKPKQPTTKFSSRVEKKVLNNGLTLLLMNNPGTKSLGLSGIIKAGKYFSYQQNSNLADVMTDLLPKGSVNYDKIAIAQALENMGIPGGLDFSVDNFRVSFGTHLVASDLGEYCKLLKDILRNPNFADEEISKAKVEWQSRFQEAMNNTKMLAWNTFRNHIYDVKHPYYEKLFAEELAELTLVSRESILDLHRRTISPSSMIIAIVGDIELNKAAKIIENSFGDWSGSGILSVQIPQVLLPKEAKRLEIKVADKQSADIVMGHPASLQRTNPDFYAARLANSALGQDTITSRLGQIVREKAGLTYGIYSSFSDTVYSGAPWSVTLTANPNNIEKAIGLAQKVLADYLERGISTDELNKEVGRAVGSFKVGLASSLGISKALAEFEFIGLGVQALDEITNEFLAVTKDAANAAAAKYMHPDRALTVIAGSL
jgi:zinc protease